MLERTLTTLNCCLNEEMAAVLHRSDGYAHHFSLHDDVSTASRHDVSTASTAGFQFRPVPFSGISPSLRNEFGRSPSTLLSGNAIGHEYVNVRTRTAADDIQARDRFSSNDGYTRHLNRHSNDDNENSSVAGFSLRAGRFGGISPRYPNEFGAGPSSFLDDRPGFLSSSVAADDVQTSRRGRSEDVGPPQPSNVSGWVLAAIENWRRQRYGRWRAPRGQMEMQLPEWLRGVEPGQEQSSVNNGNDDEEDSSVTGLSLRAGRFGGMSPRYRNEFGGNLSSFLSDRCGFLSSSVAAEDIQTSRRGHRVSRGDMAPSQQSNANESVLAAPMDGRRERDDRLQAPRSHVETQLPERLHDVEPEQRRQESSVNNDVRDGNNNNDDSGGNNNNEDSGGNNDVNDDRNGNNNVTDSNE